MDTLINAALWIAITFVAIMAGVYFTFSAFVMRALDALGAPAGMLAMQSINRIIVQSGFLPIFFASTLLCAGLAIFAALDLSAPGGSALLLGSAAYVVGMFVVTVAGNVPLNNALEATSVESPEASAIWAMYLAKWSLWNHVRTLSCTLALIGLVLALTQRL
ncbi:MAG: DUF1772 domain-containing protein [Erythrobacter sp.]|nr:DUF1772 domain-containing protein [Erythrobacter sp.]